MFEEHDPGVLVDSCLKFSNHCPFNYTKEGERRTKVSERRQNTAKDS